MRAPRGPVALLTLVALAGIAVAGTGRPGATDSYQAIALYAEAMSIIHDRYAVSYTHLTLPTNREV